MSSSLRIVRAADRPSASLPRLLVLLATLLLACTAPPETPDDGSQKRALRSCSVDAECAAEGLVCDRERRTCVCTKDAMCEGSADGAYCNAFTGRCEKDVAGCKSDAECGASAFCDISVRTCRDKRPYCSPCVQDQECGGPGDFCVRHPEFPSVPAFCAAACGADGACPEGQACLETAKGKQCVPQNGSCKASGCTADSNQDCARDADCTQGAGQRCEIGIGKCVAARASCASGQSCDPVTLQCVPSCTTDTECRERYQLDNYACVRNTCIQAASCLDDDECEPTEWCVKPAGAGASDRGLCQTTCTDSAECPIGKVCATDPVSQRNGCFDGCSDNGDCPLNAVCNDSGVCERTDPNTGKRRCQTQDACEFREKCENSTCVEKSEHCKASELGCGAGSTLGQITYYTCLAAQGDACPAGASKVKPAGFDCASPTNLAGYGCRYNLANRCLYSCAANADCPKSFSCVAGLCHPTGNNGSLCAP